MSNGCVGFFVKTKGNVPNEALQAATDAARTCGLDYYVATSYEDYDSTERNKVFDGCGIELVVAIGGDGTILRAASTALRYSVPVLGVNTGRIGFLSEIKIDSLAEAFIKIKQKEYSLEEKMVLQCSVDGGKVRKCINDVMLYKRRFSGVIEISLDIDGYNAGEVFCDGIIVSTPTGATGYSISAGGPVIAPGIDVAVITPICSHSLAVRPIITATDADIRFKMHSDGFISLDGMFCENLRPGSEIKVGACDDKAMFIRFNEKNLFSLIKEKLS